MIRHPLSPVGIHVIQKEAKQAAKDKAKRAMPSGASKKVKRSEPKKKPKKSNPEQCEASENNSGL